MGVASALPSPGHAVEEHDPAQILLEVRRAVFAFSHHAGHTEPFALKMPGDGREGSVFFHGGADDSDEGRPAAAQTVVTAVAGRGGQGFYGVGFASFVGQEEALQGMKGFARIVSC